MHYSYAPFLFRDLWAPNSMAIYPSAVYRLCQQSIANGVRTRFGHNVELGFFVYQYRVAPYRECVIWSEKFGSTVLHAYDEAFYDLKSLAEQPIY